MASDRQNKDLTADGAPGREGRSGGCFLISAILLFAILAILLAAAWLRSRNEAPNPAMSGHPPSLPAH